jgi:siroheme synthase
LGATVAIYMPGHHYSEIARKLRAAGLPAETPCAIVSRATTPEEQFFPTNLKGLKDAPRLPAPTLLLIGEVLRHAGNRLSFEEVEACWTSSELSLVMRTDSEPSRRSIAGLGEEEQGA